MIFLSFFFLLKKLVQIYQCYAVLEIIQKRERGGGGGQGHGTGKGAYGGGPARWDGNARRRTEDGKKTKQNNF